MKRLLKKYLPLYVGCKGLVRIDMGNRAVWTEHKFLDYTLVGVDVQDELKVLLKAESSGVPMWYVWRAEDFRLCLRPLSDMAEEESNMDLPEFKSQSERSAYVTSALLELRFDLFQLIDNGAAIDSTKLEKE